MMVMIMMMMMMVMMMTRVTVKLIWIFFAGDLVALFDEDDTDEVKQERNEVQKLSSVFLWLITAVVVVFFLIKVIGNVFLFQRAERLSRTLDPQQYLEFTECRQANFSE